MALLETLTLELAPAIAKNILKIWFKDKDLALDTASTFVDLIGKKTKDVVARQRAKRQFEDIGEKVATSLIPIFEREGANLDEGAIAAVCSAVAKALSTGPVDLRLLFSVDLEPTRLAAHFKILAPREISHFSQDELDLFERVLSEASQYIVDIAAQLPAFTERTIAEVLKREGKLLDIASQLIDEVQRMRAGSMHANLELSAANFEIEYRRAVVRRLDELELFGADLSRASRRHRLSVAYITLSVAALGEAKGEDALGPESQGDYGVATTTIDEALCGASHLLIKGTAGSGKTTLLQWIAVRAASQTFSEPLTELNERVPFFIRLRQYSETAFPSPEEFTRRLAPSITGRMPAGWVHDQLEEGRAVVLLDGVDEIPEHQRGELRLWLKDLAASFPSNVFIVTSRHHAVSEDWLVEEGFKELELQPMSVADIDSFVSHWHSAVKVELEDEEEKLGLVHLETNLKTVVQRNRPIRNLATSPLLCAMICALHRDMRQQLPSDRIELYEACTRMLLERRDLERGVYLSSYPKLSYRQKRAILEDFAYWLLQNGWSGIGVARADERFGRKLANMYELHGATDASAVRRLLVERSGMIREPVPGQIDFTHRTFQEFLAAQAALDEGDVGVLVKNAHDDQWRETIILSAGLAGTKVRSQLLTDILIRSVTDSAHRQELQLLAVACLETSVDLAPEVRQRVRECLEEIIPPRSMADAKALSSAGDLAVPYLGWKRHYYSREAGACVRTLTMIGSLAALEVLETYVKDNRQAVTEELWRGKDNFEPEEYGRRVLTRLARHRSSAKVRSLNGLEYVDGIVSLTVSGLTSNLEQIRSKTSLRFLSIENCKGLKDLEVLRSLPELRALRLSSCDLITSLEPIASLRLLDDLSIVAVPLVDELAPLANLTALTSLHLDLRSTVSRLDPLGELSNLTTLALRYCWAGASVPLERLSKLIDLEIVRCEPPINSMELAGLKALVNLVLLDCIFPEDLKSLQSARHLERLVIGRSRGVNNLNGLPGSVRHVTLSHLPDLATLTLVEAHNSLASLDIICCPNLVSLEGLDRFTSLRSLDLTGCLNIVDLSPLREIRLVRLVLPEAFKDNLPSWLRDRVPRIGFGRLLGRPEFDGNRQTTYLQGPTSFVFPYYYY